MSFKIRNPYAVLASNRQAGAMRSRNAPRGGDHASMIRDLRCPYCGFTVTTTHCGRWPG